MNDKKKNFFHYKKVKSIFAILVSLGMMATFAIPAFAFNNGVEEFKPNRSFEVQSLDVSGSNPNLVIQTAGFSATTKDAINQVIAEEQRVAQESNRTQQTRPQTEQPGSGAPYSQSSYRTSASCYDLAASNPSSFLAAAMAQLGCTQDCTALVENALNVTGKHVGDLAPMEFGIAGTVFSDPSQVKPGDIMMRPGHVAIYLGDGNALHGGWSGGTTAIANGSWSNPANYVSFVRV